MNPHSACLSDRRLRTAQPPFGRLNRLACVMAWLVLGSGVAWGQTAINFINLPYSFNDGIDRLVYEPQTGEPLTDTNYVAQLWEELNGAFVPAGDPTPFVGPLAPGIWVFENRTLHIPCGMPARLQVRVWDRSAFPTYEAAVLSSGVTGQSEPFLYVLDCALPQNPSAFLPFNLRAFALDTAPAGPHAPVFLVHPHDRRSLVGASASFSARAFATPAPAYQWHFNGTPIAGATNTDLFLPAVDPADRGTYSVTAVNSSGTSTSHSATLAVTAVMIFADGLLVTNTTLTVTGQVTICLQPAFPDGWTFFSLGQNPPTYAAYHYPGPFPVAQSTVLSAGTYAWDLSDYYAEPPLTITVIPAFTLAASSPGGGSVSVVPRRNYYLSNTLVTVTAQPASGWTFLQWLGDTAATNRAATLTMNRDKEIQAVFGTTLSTAVSGGGTVWVEPAIPQFPYGTFVRLNGLPNEGRFFVVWGNAANGRANPIGFPVTNTQPAISALFWPLAPDEAALTVLPIGFGRVLVQPATNLLAVNSVATLLAIPDPDQTFLGWERDASGSDNPLTVQIDDSKVITARFTTRPRFIFGGVHGRSTPEGHRLSVLGEFDEVYRIEYSTPNLAEWSPLATVTNTFGIVQFTDTDATNQPGRSYRITSP